MRVARGVMKKQGLVTAIFHSKDAASKAFDQLINRGYEARDIVMIMSQETYRSHFQRGSGLNGRQKDSHDGILSYLSRHGALRELPGTGLVVSGIFLSDRTLEGMYDNVRSILGA